jgi:hypothetical protein
MILFRVEPATLLSVPDPCELDRGTLRALLRQASVTPSQLTELL